MKTALTLTEFYAEWLAHLQSLPLSMEAMDAFNADVQAAIETPHRDRAVKTELATLMLKANRWFYFRKRELGR